jgi:hypothetical protein
MGKLELKHKKNPYQTGSSWNAHPFFKKMMYNVASILNCNGSLIRTLRLIDLMVTTDIQGTVLCDV